MTDINKLRELAELCLSPADGETASESANLDALRRVYFRQEANPQAILKLIAEVERLRGEVEAYEEGMRSLACNLGAGGYNADTLTAVQLVDKVQWGVDNLAETQSRLLDEVRTENTALRKTAERYRELRKITPHRFKKLQEAATTDGGDVFYFHADRFDAALDAALEGGGR
ncbi:MULTISPECIES: hypothetical protein [Pseudomonas]|uniref:hypothetical protein n=1 Tax=Pseudomonas TaxID=286 RepID=UPI0008A29640|nr:MULTISPECIES: hypothetical protein [Pseudomonas]OFR56899.1 hypothetical protein HMPREF2886_01825 [Pseudomonas sp. HMSC066A08]RUE48107.1 hypothetical protein IPC1224_30345 [Pseudomonas aeruginosa]